ncbi:MAG TPA: uroporphyrinogen-III synthase, partial [Methanomassiliicoccales archaeon]|nr:uroporphyrinogen-III synthase [Methanomassiliicoccales archaeon]
ALSRFLRERLERELNDEIELMGQILQELRNELKSTVSDQGEREEMLRSIDVLVIGPHTSAPLVKEGVDVALMPDEFSSEGMIEAIPKEMIEGRRIWILGSDMGSRTLPNGLRDSGGLVEEVVVYHLRKNLEGDDVIALLDMGGSGGIDGFAFTSSLSARTILEAGRLRVGEGATMEMMKNAMVGAIGEPTKAALEYEGVRVDTVPEAADFRLLLMSMKNLV